MDFGEKWGKNGLFCPIDPVTAQKVSCHGRLLNTNLFCTTNRPDWDKRESYRKHQDSNYDWISMKNGVKMAFFAKLGP